MMNIDTRYWDDFYTSDNFRATREIIEALEKRVAELERVIEDGYRKLD